MEADNAPKWWHADICKIERKHAEIMHINIDNTLNGGENTRSGENTHTYPYDFLLDLNSNLSPILPRFRDIRAFVRQKPLLRYPSPILAKIPKCSPSSRSVMLGSAPRRANTSG